VVKTVGSVLFVACCFSVGCGGGATLKTDGAADGSKADGASGGSTGATAGAAGAVPDGGGNAGTGGAGARAGGGGGNAGASVDGGLEARPPLACPAQAPADGTSCAQEGLNCEWGDDVRGDKCRSLGSCASHHWSVTTPDSSSCAPLQAIGMCPANTFSACTNNTTCTKEDGTSCRCTNSPPLSGATLDPPEWYCPPRQDPGTCPASQPNLGTACQPDGAQCPYIWVDCRDPVRICAGGAWLPGSPAGCPVPP
jgi:hypothetical protein